MPGSAASSTILPNPTQAANSAANAAPAVAQSASADNAAGKAGNSEIDVLGISLPILDISPWSLLTATGALLAFLVGLFTLIGRERKSPYIINSVFAIFLICLVGATADVIAATLNGRYLGQVFLYFGVILLVLAMSLSVWRLYKVYVRFVLFVDSPHPKHWPVVRSINSVVRSIKKTKDYEHNPRAFDQRTLQRAMEILERVGNEKSKREPKTLASAAIAVRDQHQSSQILADLALVFLSEKYPVQYMATSRHPIHFVEQLKGAAVAAGHDWQSLASQIVAVDAYTEHFGYTDSVYYRDARRLQAELNVVYLTSGPTYAGLHSASSKAFNVLRNKSKQAGNVRQPVFIIYEDCAALVDLESAEQYKVFVRHVLPSERMWGGMFTLFVETSPSKAEWALLAAYADISVRAEGSGV